jgi:CBS domain-containing protein
VMLKNPFVLHAAMPMREAMKQVLDRHYPVYPVVDAAGRLLGLVRGQAMFEAQAIEITLQAGSMMGVEKEERITTPWFLSLKLRHPWLQLNLLTAFLAAAVVGLFQDTLDRLVILALFLPVLAGQSGNTGCQALAVTLRGMTLGELHPGAERRLARLPERHRCGHRCRHRHVHHRDRAAPAASLHARLRGAARDGGGVRCKRSLRRDGAAHVEALRIRPRDGLEHFPHDGDRCREHGNAARACDASRALIFQT